MADLTPTQMDALARVVREIRGGIELSQEAVADAGDLNRNTVGSIERREIGSPSLGTLLGLARGLGVPLSEIIRRFEDRLD